MSWGEGSMNWAELRDLIEALPEDSATKAAMAGDCDKRRWSEDTYIAASAYNALLLLVKVMWTAHLKGAPPDLATIDPPHLDGDERAEELAQAIDARNKAVLDRYRPETGKDDTAARQAEVDHWMSKIRELEAAQPQPQQ